MDATDYATVCATALAMLDDGDALEAALPFTEQMDWMPFYPAKFYGNPKVDVMNDRQQHRYRRLLDKSWQLDNPCFIPADLDVIGKLAGCTAIDFQQDASVVLARFKLTQDGRNYYNAFLLTHYLEALPAYMNRRAAARETNRKRKAKRIGGATVNATDNASDDATVHATEATVTDTVTVTTNSKTSPNCADDGLPPEGLTRIEYARKFWDELETPCAGNLEIVGDAIEIYAKKNKLDMNAVTVLFIARAKLARDRGETINRFWFQDGKQLKTGDSNGKPQSRQQQIEAAIRGTDDEDFARMAAVAGKS